MTVTPPFQTTKFPPLVPLPMLSVDPDFNRLHSLSNIAGQGVGIVNLTGSSPGVAYVHNFRKTAYAASLVKIAAMFAAFHLQDRVWLANHQIPASSFHRFSRRLKKDWTPHLRRGVPRATGDFPRMEKIFQDRTGAFNPSFLLDMQKMIGPSKNGAAGRCIRAIGYDYINAALASERLNSKGEGLWLVGDYAPSSFTVMRDGKPTKVRNPVNRDGRSQPGIRGSQVASVRAVLGFLARLRYGRLVSHTASRKMRDMMWGTWAPDHYDPAELSRRPYGKLGVGLPKSRSEHDCAVVHRIAGGKRFTYGVVVLFRPPGAGHSLARLYRTLDEIAIRKFAA